MICRDFIGALIKFPARADAEGFTRLKAELTKAFAAPDSAYKALDADTVIKRNARKRK